MTNYLNPDVARVIRESGLSLKAFWMHIVDEDEDFELSTLNGKKTYRFIQEDFLDSIMQEELSCDTYVLGSFNSNFLAGILNIPEVLIKAAQSAGEYEAVGEAVLQLNKLAELQEAYVSADSYGHHFAHYDFNEEELYIQDGLCYYMFRTY